MKESRYLGNGSNPENAVGGTVAPGVGFEPTRPDWATGCSAFLTAPGLSSFLR